MDPYLLAELGIIATLVPLSGSIVKQTVDNLRSALKFGPDICVQLSYALNLILVTILYLATLSSPPATGFAVVVLIAKIVVGGWLAGNYAGAITDTHNRARKDSKKEQEFEEVPRVPTAQGAL